MSDPRDELAALINGGPLPTNQTVGGIYARHVAYERADAIIAAGWVFDGSCRDCQATNGHHPWCTTRGDTQHRHHYVDVSTFADADNGLHRWLCECGGATLSRDRA